VTQAWEIVLFWEKWRARGDDFRTLLRDFVTALPLIELSVSIELVVCTGLPG
jgi:hypothetical protein